MTKRFQVALAALMLWTATIASPLRAQETSVPNQPFVTVAITDLDELLGDINYFTQAIEMPQSGMLVGSFAAAFTQGVDRTRPLGVFVQLDDNQVPAPLVMLPVTDLNAFLKGLEPYIGQPDVLGDGTLVIALGSQLVYIRDADGWAYAARDQATLASVPASAAAKLVELTKTVDLNIELNVQAVPEPLRNLLMTQLEVGFEQAMDAQPGDETSKEVSKQAARQQMEMLKRVIEQTEKLQIGLVIDAAEQHVGLDILNTAAEGTEMAQMAAELQVIPSRFTSFVQPDAAMYAHGAMKFGPLYRKQTEDALKALPVQIKGMLDAAVEEGKLDAEARQVADQLVADLIDLARDGIAKGYSDSGMVLRTEPEGLSFVLGASPVSGPKFEAIAARIKKMVEAKSSDARFTLNAETYQGVNLHRVEVDVPADEEDARKVFGEKLQLLIGTSPDSLYLAFGNQSTERVKQAISAAAEGPKSLPNQLPSQIRISMLPILEYAQSIAQNSMLDMVLQTAKRFPEQSNITILSNFIPRGNYVKFRVEEGVLRVLGTMAQASRQQPQF